MNVAFVISLLCAHVLIVYCGHLSTPVHLIARCRREQTVGTINEI